MLLRTPLSCENGTRSAAAAENCEFVGEVVAFPARVIFASVGSLMIVGGVVGNSMLLVVPTTQLLGHKTRGTHTLGLFISNLAVADISSLLNWPVLLVLDMILGYHPVLSKTHCVATAVIGVCCHIVSASSLVGISLSRYVYVCHTKHFHRFFSHSRSAAFCVLSWLLGCVLTLPALHQAAAPFAYDGVFHMCFFQQGSVWVRVGMAVFTFLPVVVVVCLSLLIFHFCMTKQVGMTDKYRLLLRLCERRADLPIQTGSALLSPKTSQDRTSHVTQIQPARIIVEDSRKTNDDRPENTASDRPTFTVDLSDPEVAGKKTESKIPQDTLRGKTDSPGENILPMVKVQSGSNCESDGSPSEQSPKWKGNVLDVETGSRQDQTIDSVLHITIEPVKSKDSAEPSRKTGSVLEVSFKSLLKSSVESITKRVHKGSVLPTTSNLGEKEKVTSITLESVKEDVSAVDRRLDKSKDGVPFDLINSGETSTRSSSLDRTNKARLLWIAITRKVMKNNQRDHSSTLSLSTTSVTDTSGSDAKTELIQKLRSVSMKKPIIMLPTLTKIHIRTQRRRIRSQKISLVKSIFMVCMVVTVGLIPCFILSLLRSYYRPRPRAEAFIAGNMLVFACKASSWVVYGLLNTSFRRDCSRFLVRTLAKCCCNRER